MGMESISLLMAIYLKEHFNKIKDKDKEHIILRMKNV